MAVTEELVAFLKDCLDEDELFAREAVDREWFSTDNYVESRDGGEVARFEIKADARHASGWSPARVLAEVAAKRRIIDTLERAQRDTDDLLGVGCYYGLRMAVRLLASVYRGRPGWRAEWAPDEEETRG